MMKCAACGTECIRLRPDQRYCRECEQRIRDIEDRDSLRRAFSRWRPKDLTGGMAL